MKASTLAGFLTVAVLGGAGSGWSADPKDNPYQDIVGRNAFALNPKPPAPPPGSEQPAAAAVEVQLTGITTIGGTPKVLLQVTEKGPNKKTEYPPPLMEKDLQGRIEVVSIDAEKGAVTIKIDGNEKQLTFEKDAPKAGGPPSMVPGAVRPGLPLVPNPAGTVPLPGVTTAAAAAAAANPQGSSVLVGGAQPTVPTPGAVSAASYLNAAVPNRPVRTTAPDATVGAYSGGTLVGGAGAGAANPQTQTPTAPVSSMTREQAIAHIEEQRRMIREATDLGLIPQNKFPPLPPTPMSPPQPVPVPAK